MLGAEEEGMCGIPLLTRGDLVLVDYHIAPFPVCEEVLVVFYEERVVLLVADEEGGKDVLVGREEPVYLLVLWQVGPGDHQEREFLI